ncbi:MAG: hypothetical protein ACLR6B_10470 [Blautia sp.]
MPEILIENPMSHNAVKFPHEGENYLCIGFDCGYMTGSDRVADLMEDEGMFGFYGTRRLMEMLREAYQSKADVQEMIVKSGVDHMSRLCVFMLPLAPDYSGAASALFDLKGIVVMHDASGCTGNFTGYDEPRWMGSRSAVYCSGLRRMDAVLGNDENSLTPL